MVEDLPIVMDVPPRDRRIVSLCPSTTETLWALGVGERLVGRTSYCCRPADVVPRIREVGGTKTVKIDRIAALDPHLVVAVKEENDRAQVEAIAARWPTVVLDPVDVPTAVADVGRLGAVVGCEAQATELAARIRTAFAGLPDAGGIEVLYLIWRRPWMAVGAGTFIDDVLDRLGFDNVARRLEGRYPTLEDDAPPTSLVLASSEPFPFTEAHRPELEARFPRARLAFVDGELFSWHGVRMVEAAQAFAELVPALAASPR